MRHKYAITVILFFFSVTCQAQQPKITVGKPHDVIEVGGKFLLSNGNEILAVKHFRETIYLQKFNTDNLTLQKIRSYNDFPEKFVVENITDFEDKYYVFYSVWDGKIEQLFAREIDFADGSFKGEPKSLIRQNGKFTGTIRPSFLSDAGVYDKFVFCFSKDRTTLSIQYTLGSEDGKESFDNVNIHVFDKNLTEKWSKEVRMPYFEPKMNGLDYAVDSKGNFYIASLVFDDGKTPDKKKDKKDMGSRYHVEILKASAAGATTKTPVSLGGKFVKTLRLHEDGKGNMICVGLYNIGKNEDSADGIILFKQNQNNEIYDFKTFEFPISLLTEFAGERFKRTYNIRESEGSAEFENLNIREIVIEDDGGIVILCEQSSSSTVQYNSLTHLIRYCNDILAAKIDESANLKWMRRLPKRQISETTTGIDALSLHYFMGTGKHYVLFVDNEKNMHLPPHEAPVEYKDGTDGFLTAYIIDDTSGDTNKISILDVHSVQGMNIYKFMPYKIQEISPSSFVFEVYKKNKEDVLIKVDMPK